MFQHSAHGAGKESFYRMFLFYSLVRRKTIQIIVHRCPVHIITYFCLQKKDRKDGGVGRLKQPGADQAKKRAAVAEQPPQMGVAGSAESYLPAKSGEPAEFGGWCAAGECSRGPVKTAQLKSNARGIEKGVIMAVMHPHGVHLMGDHGAATGAEQGRFFFRPPKGLRVGVRRDRFLFPQDNPQEKWIRYPAGFLSHGTRQQSSGPCRLMVYFSGWTVNPQAVFADSGGGDRADGGNRHSAEQFLQFVLASASDHGEKIGNR
jgi:hypothetical protein